MMRRNSMVRIGMFDPAVGVCERGDKSKPKQKEQKVWRCTSLKKVVLHFFCRCKRITDSGSLKAKLKMPRPYISFRSIQTFFAGIFCVVLFFFIPYNTYKWLQSLPNPRLLSRRDLEVTTKIFDRNGALLYEIYADQNRTPIAFSEIPEHIKQATIAIEDKDFYRHNGISIKGIIRALRTIALEDKIQGGSTITQQLIKSALLSPEINVSRKIKEALLALWAEAIYSKNEILEMYLNQVPYGGTAWGIEAAAHMYFGKSVKDLTLGEAAILAGFPQAPTEYSPFGSHPEKALERQALVLNHMVEEGFITKEEAEEAKSEELVFAQQRVNMRAPHFVMYIKELLEKRYGARVVEKGGLNVKTSLDIRIQEMAEDTVRNKLSELSQLKVGNGAVLITKPVTGEILAMVGSRDYWDIEKEGNVNVTTRVRPPGSTIKVVNYAAALESEKFTAASVLYDTPVTYAIQGSESYKPINYDNTFHGPVPLRYALANSYNVPAVKVLDKIGVKTMIEKGRLMGIESWKDESRYGLSLTLGGGDVTMLDMARVFGTLANKGKSIDFMPILEVADYQGKVLEKNEARKGVQAVKEEAAWIISNILSDSKARVYAFGSRSDLEIKDKHVSVKTGTSNDKRDNWTIGYTPSFLVTVWVGNNDNTPMHPMLSSGITGAAPIWRGIMEELLKDKGDEVEAQPQGVVSVPCYYGRPEYFIKGTEPAKGRCDPLPEATPSATLTPSPGQ